jgi:uncharacterized protein YyaL (SSP411 family)
MADWLVDIQLEDGGIQGGHIDSRPIVSETFVTGQALFGYVAAAAEWEDDRFLVAAKRAGDYLLNNLGDDGEFHGGFSLFSSSGHRVFEVRTALAIAQLGVLARSGRYVEAAQRMADAGLKRQHSNGWWPDCELWYDEPPLTHTISYVLEGLVGLASIVDRPDYLVAARRTLDRIGENVSPTGFLAGLWRPDWSPAAEWACLTGSAQLAGVMLNVDRQIGNRHYHQCAERLLSFVCYTQELKVGDPGLDGGIRGSFPFVGKYGRWCVLNWATKFFADSMMDYLEATSQSV